MYMYYTHNIFIQQGYIKLIKSDSKDLYIKLSFKKAVL